MRSSNASTVRFLTLLFVSAVLSATALRAAEAAIRLDPVLQGLSSPLYITNAHDGSNRLFVIEQAGRVKVLAPDATVPTLFLDITSRVLSGGERGLLGLAFHPQFSTNARFFVNYTRQTDGATVIAEYHAAADPAVTAASEIILLTIAQPYANHNGGMIEFGFDEFLYIGMGDGGSANDPESRAQNINELLGKILRIDVDHSDGALKYASPPQNPFAGATPGRDEIFAVGMRNPYRFSFDRQTGQLYVGDVGQGAVEEVDIVTVGGNYGWRVYEGTQCTGLNSALCIPANFVMPIAQYGHTGGRCSITGGYVYRGSAGTLPSGTYVFGDYCSGEIFSPAGGAASLLLDTTLNISSFGEDEAGEVYVVGLGGTVHRISSTATTTTLTSSPNPATAGAAVTLTASVTGTGATPGGSVNFTENGTSLSGCSAKVLNAAGNATCSISNLAPGVHSIVASYGGDAGNAASSSAPLSQVINAVQAGSSNVALASAGAVASASSTYSAAYPASAVNNNERAGTNWGNGGGWNDGTADAYPDTVQILFNGTKTLNKVVVYTLQDNYNNPVEPTDTLTFSNYGVRDFTVEGYTGSAWVVLGTVTGNTLVKRTVTFNNFTTDRIRVNITNALSSYSRLTEIEAWGVAAQGQPPVSTATVLTSSANPAQVGDTVVLTASVTGNAASGTITFTEGGNAFGCAPATLVPGNPSTATCSISSLTAGTHNLVASYGGDSANLASVSPALAQGINAGSTSSNVALASAGAVASASSTYGAAFAASAVNNNERAGTNWGNGGGWNDGTADAYPDTVQILFNGTKTLNKVVVYTLQDNYNNPVEPTDTLTFSNYGVRDFTVEGYTGSAWVVLGTVTGNTLVKRTVTFNNFTTDRIRVNITNALSSYSRLTEIEAWGVAAQGQPPVSTATVLTSSANPAQVGDTVVLTASVTGNAASGTITFTEGGNAFGCAPATLVPGNPSTATCSISSLTAGTHNLVASYGGDSANIASVSPALAQGINAGSTSSNVALASAGAVASASSTYSAAFAASAVNNNERAGTNWGNGGGWNDGTADAYPDTVQILFNGTKTLNKVVVYTLQDNYNNPVEPTDTLTFSNYGVRDFTVEGYTGSAWVVLGTVTGNTLVKRTVTFNNFTTDRIRVNITNALFSFSRLTEIEAWTAGP